MEILELYKSILESVGAAVADDGLVSIIGEESNTPSMVSSKRLVLPTHEVLRKPDWQHCIAFHPMSENILRGESAIIKHLRLMMGLRLSTTIVRLASELMAIAANTAYHGKLTPKQSEFLSHVPDASEKTVKIFDKVIGKMGVSGDTRVIGIYLKRGGSWKGAKRSRVAVVSFPILDEFEKDGRDIFGVVMSGKEKETIQKLFEYILPNGNDLEEYSFGSDSQCAPYFHALLKAYINVATRLNAVVKKFKAHLDDVGELLIDVDWEDDIADLAKYRDLIPSLAGNDGESEQKQEAVQQVSSANGLLVNTGAANVVNNMKQEAMKASAAITAPPAVSPMQPQAQQPAFNSGLLGGGAPATGVRVNSNGAVDFNSIVATNPMLQQQQLMLQQQMFQMQQPQAGSGGYAGYSRGQPPQQMMWQQPQQQMPMNTGWPMQQQQVAQQLPWMPQQQVMQQNAVYGGV